MTAAGKGWLGAGWQLLGCWDVLVAALCINTGRPGRRSNFEVTSFARSVNWACLECEYVSIGGFPIVSRCLGMFSGIFVACLSPKSVAYSRVNSRCEQLNSYWPK